MPLTPSTYRVLRSIPHTGVAEVDVCEHPVFGSEIVRKRVDLLGLEDAVAFQEPRLLHDIKHRHVAEILDAQVVQYEGLPILEMYMPYYPEGSVLDRLQEKSSFSHHEAVQIGLDVLSALTYLHQEAGYLHRDVKPGNILLEEGGRHGRLTDFGSAARLDARGLARGSLGRSPLYEPPEAASGSSGVRGDLYALGLCLFEMFKWSLSLR